MASEETQAQAAFLTEVEPYGAPHCAWPVQRTLRIHWTDYWMLLGML